MLRNFTRLSALLPNAKRWGETFHMVNRFVRIRTELINVSNEEICVLPIDASPQFSQNAKAYILMLHEINTVTNFPQKRCWPLN